METISRIADEVNPFQLERLNDAIEKIRINQQIMIERLMAILDYSRQISTLEDERSRLIDSINELRYEKYSPLDNYTALEHRDKTLIES